MSRRDAPPLLEAIISRCLPKDPNARWQSMKEVEKALSGLKRTLDSNVFYPPTQLPLASWRRSDPEVNTATTRPAGPPSHASLSTASGGSGASACRALRQSGRRRRSLPLRWLFRRLLGRGSRFRRAPAQAAQSSSKNLGLVLGLIAVVLVSAAAAGGWWWWNNRSKPLATSPPATAQAPAPQTAIPRLHQRTDAHRTSDRGR